MAVVWPGCFVTFSHTDRGKTWTLVYRITGLSRLDSFNVATSLESSKRHGAVHLELAGSLVTTWNGNEFDFTNEDSKDIVLNIAQLSEEKVTSVNVMRSCHMNVWSSVNRSSERWKAVFEQIEQEGCPAVEDTVWIDDIFSLARWTEEQCSMLKLNREVLVLRCMKTEGNIHRLYSIVIDPTGEKPRIAAHATIELGEEATSNLFDDFFEKTMGNNFFSKKNGLDAWLCYAGC